MADSAERKKKKRKHDAALKQVDDRDRERLSKASRRSTEEEDDGTAAAAAEEVEVEVERGTKLEAEEHGRWRNLEILLLIESKDLDAHKKVDTVLDYMKFRSVKDDDNDDGPPQTLSFSRVITHVSDWIQSLLISSEKKARAVAGDAHTEVLEFCLDYRCWEIFRFCLKESLTLNVYLSLSRDLLRVISSIAGNALCSYKVVPLSNNRHSEGKGADLYSLICDCLSFVFCSHGGISNGNLDLWAGACDSILKLAIKVYEERSCIHDARNSFVKLSCLVLESFSRFLRVHPCRKSGFRDFVGRLLEPLLHLLGLLQDQVDASIMCTGELCRSINEVIQFGLFHPVHIDDFLIFRCTEGYSSSMDGKLKVSKTMIKSYHRHLFDKLENIARQRKVLMFSGIGQLFRLFVDSVKKQRRDTLSEGHSSLQENQSLDHLVAKDTSSDIRYQKKDHSPDINSQARKSMFDFFVLIVEPLLLDMKTESKAESLVDSSLINIFYAVKSVNKMLTAVIEEKLYHRTEDSTGGANLIFFKVIYSTIVSYIVKVNQLWVPTGDQNGVVKMDMLISTAKELALGLKCFVEIEYQVLGDDLVDIWLIIIAFLTLSHYVEGMLQASPLTLVTMELACKLLKLYTDLRQVSRAVFALCGAVRHLSFDRSSTEMTDPKLVFSSSSSLHEVIVKSTRFLFCSPKFRQAICKAIKTIPEGQASECLETITTDISASLEWMTACCSAELDTEPNKGTHLGSDVQANLLALLSEIYTQVLDSISVTTGNSKGLGLSVEKLMMLLRPHLSSALAHQLGGCDEFSHVATENMLKSNKKERKTKDIYPWISLFLFHLYMYCRSLFREALSLMPPDCAKELSAVFGDPVANFCRSDWMKRTDLADEGYFSWILRPSASLHAVIESVMDNFVREESTSCCPLAYVMCAMTFQRLADLNRRIQSLDYLILSDDSLLQNNLIDSPGHPILPKKRKKWVKLLASLKQEAANLTDFVMVCISKIKSQQLPVSTAGITVYDSSFRTREKNYSWDLALGSVNEKTLPIALWWLACQNLDLWCIYASKSKLKSFLSILIHSAIASGGCDVGDVRKDADSNAGDKIGVTMHQISLELLHDTVFYEQKFVCRYLASRFSSVLEKILPLSADSTDAYVKLKSLPDWKEVLIALENSPIAACGKGLIEECRPDRASFATKSSTVAAFQNSLNLVCQVPKRSLSRKSFTLYATFLLNCERIVVGSIAGSCWTLPSKRLNCLLKVLVSCRSALKYLVMEYCEDRAEANEYPILPIFSETSFPILWLLKSLNVVERHYDLCNDGENSEVFFSLMDHTSYLFSTLCKYPCSFGIRMLLDVKNPSKEHPVNGPKSDQSCSTESTRHTNSSIIAPALKLVASVAETLKDRIQATFSDVPAGQDSDVGLGMGDLNNILPLASCFRGFLCGLASSLDHDDVKEHDLMIKLVKNKLFSTESISRCIDKFVELMEPATQTCFMGSTKEPGTNLDATWQLQSCNCATSIEIREPLQDRSDVMEDENQPLKSETVNSSMLSSDVDDDSDSCAYINNSILDYLQFSSSVKQVGSFTDYRLREGLLRGFLVGENMKLASLLRELFFVATALLRLDLQTKCSPFSSSLMEVLFRSSWFLLMELFNMTQVPKPYSFALVDGSLKYLEEVGSRFACTSPTKPMPAYSRLINLYMKALGKCIILQGKGAADASLHTGSCLKTLESQSQTSGSYVSPELCHVEELRARLRMSFMVIIKKSSDIHLSSAVQEIKRALVGVHKRWSILCELNTGAADGGSASSTLAAGIDCLDLVLERVTGHQHLSAVRSQIQSIVPSLFNIILHLQGPAMFYGKRNTNEANAKPDPGAVVLMCVDVLIKITRKHALFRMDSGHVGQYLRIPAALFQNFHHLRLDKSSNTTNNQHTTSSLLLDKQFSLKLYAASCRLLCTVVKHHKSECIQCISLLQSSVQALLYSLELVDMDSSYKESRFTWEVQEGINCASHLRRVYEEIRQQRDVLGQHCFLFLSDYIWIYSGYGPLKKGIKREIDDALRPGIYALADVCSANDLQYLHTVFGEGPCRSTLATLRQDYKLKFQYMGKV